MIEFESKGNLLKISMKYPQNFNGVAIGRLCDYKVELHVDKDVNRNQFTFPQDLFHIIFRKTLKAQSRIWYAMISSRNIQEMRRLLGLQMLS